MSYFSPKDPYNRYAFLRWWCQNQWWVQIVVPCIICAGVIGGLLYYWNNERQQQAQGKLLLMQYGYEKDHPPKLDPDVDEIAAAWRVIRMKKNDPSMPISFKKKQLIVKHWKSIIVDMKVEEIQRLHDLLQDQPYKPTDDVEIDIRKIEAPWKDDDSLKDFGANLEEAPPEDENASEPAKTPASDGKDDRSPPSSGDSKAPQNDDKSKKTAPENSPVKSDNSAPEEGDSENVPDQEEPAANDETDEENAFQEETPDQSPVPEKTENSKKPEAPARSVSYYPKTNVSETVEPILLDSPEKLTADDSTAHESAASYTDIDILDLDQPKSAKGRIRSKKVVGQATAFEDVGPLEDNFLQQREDFIKKALEERNRKIEEFKKSQDPYQFIPTPWKRNPIVI